MASYRKRMSGDSARWDVTVTRRGAPRQTRTFQTRTAAERWAREMERDVDRGAWRSTDYAERTTVAELINGYESNVLSKTRSADKWKSIARKIAGGELGKLPLLALTAERVARYRDQRLEARVPGRGHKYSSQTIRHEVALLKRAIAHAMREWGLHLPAGNPAAVVALPAPAEARERRLSEEEAKLLLEEAYAARARTLGPAIEFAIETAMRRGELCALLWSDVDLTQCVAHVRMSKNGDSRHVPLSRRAVEILADMPRPIRGGRVFGLSAGGFSQAFDRLVTRLGFENLRLHDLRHEATSRLAEKLNGDVVALASITGHKTLSMLMRYTHLRAAATARRLA